MRRPSSLNAAKQPRVLTSGGYLRLQLPTPSQIQEVFIVLIFSQRAIVHAKKDFKMNRHSNPSKLTVPDSSSGKSSFGQRFGRQYEGYLRNYAI